MYYYLECFTMFIFAIWGPENAISANSSTGIIKAMISDILVLGLELSPLFHCKLRFLD